MTTRVLITGIAGFIGSHLVDRMPKRKYDIFGLDNMSTGNIMNLKQSEKKVQELIEGDICDTAAVLAAFKKYKPDVVVHLAAQPSLLTSVKLPNFDALVNNVGTINILMACREYGVEKLIYSSTSAITSSPVVHETFNPMQLMLPDNPYGMSKRHAEDYINMLFKDNSIVLRFANVYGPRQVPLGENQLIPRIIRHLLYDDKFEIYGDGMQLRDYIYVQDVADLIVKILDHRYSSVKLPINVGTGELSTVNQVVETVLDVAEVTEDIKHGEAKDNRNRVSMVVQNAKSYYKWKAKTNLHDGIEKTWNWWKNERNRTDTR